jgi:hypothetical protein
MYTFAICTLPTESCMCERRNGSVCCRVSAIGAAAAARSAGVVAAATRAAAASTASGDGGFTC